MNASNTVVIKDGRLIAYNTDGTGFFKIVERRSSRYRPFKINFFFCIGAGGDVLEQFAVYLLIMVRKKYI